MKIFSYSLIRFGKLKLISVESTHHQVFCGVFIFLLRPQQWNPESRWLKLIRLRSVSDVTIVKLRALYPVSNKIGYKYNAIESPGTYPISFFYKMANMFIVS